MQQNQVPFFKQVDSQSDVMSKNVTFCDANWINQRNQQSKYKGQRLCPRNEVVMLILQLQFSLHVTTVLKVHLGRLPFLLHRQ